MLVLRTLFPPWFKSLAHDALILGLLDLVLLLFLGTDVVSNPGGSALLLSA
jgi:hypothetical protein